VHASTRARRRIGGAVVTVAGLGGLAWWAVGTAIDGPGRCGALRAFTAARWRGLPVVETARTQATRQCITDDLVARGFLRGRTATEIADSLGPPQAVRWSGRPALVYDIGPTLDRRVVGERLVLMLDAGGRVVAQQRTGTPDSFGIGE
jgi:hypothetical protein